MPKSIDIKELKDISNRTGIDHWTIKLVGDLERDPSLETEVKVNVLLQPFHPSDLDGYSRFPDCANEDYRSLKLGVGALPALKKGSIWYKGRLTATRFGQRADYMIDNSSDEGRFFIKAWDKFDKYRYYLPPHFYRVPKRYKDIELLKIDGVDAYGDSVELFIPCMVLNQTYFCRTTNLTKHFFNGTICNDLNSLVDVELSGKFDCSNMSELEISEYLNSLKLAGSERKGMLKINPDDLFVAVARQKTRNSEARVLAKVLASKYYLGAAKSVFNSCMADRSQGNQVNPKGFFPFKGQSNISVTQIPLFDQNSVIKKYLITSIIKCSSSKPYGECVVYRNNSGDQADPETDMPEEDKKEVNRPRKKKHPESENDQHQSEDDADDSVDEYLAEISIPDCEPLADELPLKPSKEKCEYKSNYSDPPITQEPDTTKLGTSDGFNSGTNVTPTNFQPKEKDKRNQYLIPIGFDFFVKSINALNNFDGFDASLRSVGNVSGLIPAKILTLDNKDWSYLNYKSKIVRNFMVADIVYKEWNFTMIEIERRDGESFKLELVKSKAKGSMISDDLFDQLLIRVIEAQGRVKNISKFPRGVVYPSKQGANGNVYGVKHTWKIKNGDVETAVDKCAERIADYIKGCLENADAQVAELKLNTDRKEDRTGFKSNPMSVRDSNLLLRE